MRGAIWIFLSAVLALVVPPSAVGADFAGVDAIFGRPPVRSGDVYRYAFPRGDLTVTLDGWANDDAVKLARALRSGLDKVGVAPKAPETGRP